MADDNPTKTGKKRKKSPAKEARDALIIDRLMAGETQSSIAKDMGLNKETVCKVANSDQAKETRDALRNALLSLGADAVQTFQDALKQRLEFGQMGHALRAAERVLKEHGAITDEPIKLELPKPVVIVRRDGSSVELGLKEGEDKDGD